MEDSTSSPALALPVDLEAQVRLLFDIEAIKRLKALYCHYCNTGWPGAGSDADAATELFTQDGVYETPMTGRLIGRTAIHEQFTQFGLEFELALHLASSPLIEVQGDRAWGRWQGLNALMSPGGRSYWSGGSYEETYVRTEAGWKFAEIIRRRAFVAAHPGSWAETGDDPSLRWVDGSDGHAGQQWKHT